MSFFIKSKLKPNIETKAEDFEGNIQDQLDVFEILKTEPGEQIQEGKNRNYLKKKRKSSIQKRKHVVSSMYAGKFLGLIEVPSEHGPVFLNRIT